MNIAPDMPPQWTPDAVYRRSLRTLQREHGFEPLRVVGEVPRDLAGTLYRASPSVFESFGRPYSHPFEADGGLTAVRFPGKGWTPSGATRLVQSDGLLAEREAGKPLYSSPAPWWRRVLSGLRQDVKNTGNTAVLHWQGRLFALMEACPPTEFDANLATIGETRLDGLVAQAFTAHPHRVPARRATYAFGLNYGKTTRIDLYELPDVGAPSLKTSIPLSFPTLVHDFAVTAKHAVFLVAPAPLVMWRAVLRIGGFSDFVSWEPDRGGMVLVVPLDDPDRVRRVEVEPFWVWHFGGCWEDRDEIVVDMARYSNLGSLEAIEGAEEAELARLFRMRIDPVACTARSEQLWDGAVEFPVVHPRRYGVRHRHTWAVTDGGIARIDHANDVTARVHALPAHRMATEPIFVPGEGVEASGWILSMIYDAELDRSYLAILDAADLEAPAVAELWFDQRIPITFHGTYVPEGR